ncbi:uncharacterized protein LOC111936741 [Cyanistes caeruleus]|uniref:uncharacterized protein LOC111936741 n=1 Tax=Cyanistes caeruleus TaxID=156563 RepID=UPI000CDA9773|nr:uncharacterized protein LOC111936741 [Cyanistes caeruleus]
MVLPSSCRHRCCPGRNNACWAPAARRARCYCDSYCQRTGDCCQDYLATCRRAGEWRWGWHWPDRGWGHQPVLLCSVASVCCYLLAPCFEQCPSCPLFPCRMSGWPRCSEGARGLWAAGDGSAVTASQSGQCGTQQHKPPCHRRCLAQGRGTGGCSEGAKQDSWAWGVQNQPALGTQIWSGAGHGPLDNCSSQLFLISGEISRVPAQRDAHRDEVLREQLTMPLHWQGSGERGCWGHSALALPPLSSPPCCISPALSIVRDTETLSFPSAPSLAAVGCAVGPWGPWSGCSSPCGVGSRARSRQVTVPPRHGGDPCPDLKQRRGCLGQHPACGTAKEVAKILPNSFSQDFRDPWRRAGLPLPEEPSGYVRSRAPLTTNNLSSAPKAGTPPAPPLQSWVQSAPPRSRAFLLFPAITFLPAPNHGPSPLPSYCGYFRLTQVGPPCRGRAWSRRLHRDKQVCVECRGNLPHHRPHCTGHGLQGARSFWVATSVVGCQGSWVQEGLQEGCICSPPALMFV